MAEEHTPRRRSAKASQVYAALVGLLLCVLAGFGYGYYRLVYFVPRLQQHVPASASFALYANLQQVVLFEPVRRYWFPLFEGLTLGEGGLDRVQRASGVNLPMDMREILVTVSPDGGWLVACAGRFRAEDLFKALATKWLDAGYCTQQGTRLDCRAGTVLLSRDDVLILAQNADVAAEAALRSRRGAELGLKGDAAFSWGAVLQSSAGLKLGAGSNPGAASNPGAVNTRASALAELEGEGLRALSGSIEPSNPLGVSAQFTWDRDVSAEQSERTFRHMLGQLPPGAREIGVQVLAAVQFQSQGNQTRAGATLPRQLLFDLAERFSAWIALGVQN